MKIFVRSGNDVSESATCNQALLNWYADQIEWSRPERLRGQPIECGRTDREFVCLVTALIERQWGGRFRIARGAEHELACMDALIQLAERKIVRIRVEE